MAASSMLGAGFSSPLPQDEALDINNAGVSTGLATVLEGNHLAWQPFIHDGRRARVLETDSGFTLRGLDINGAGDVLIGGNRGSTRSQFLYRDGQVTGLPRFGRDSSAIVTTYHVLNDAGRLLCHYAT